MIFGLTLRAQIAKIRALKCEQMSFGTLYEIVAT
jgi:hypothetical protein